MRKEIKRYLQLKNNPLADHRTILKLREQISLLNVYTLSEEERIALSKD